MVSAVQRSAVVILVLLLAACGGSAPTSPTTLAITPTPTFAIPTSSFPPLAGPARTFMFDRELSYRVSFYTLDSRFVLYDNGGFELQYGSMGIRFRGGYAEANGLITFDWETPSHPGAWGATGTLRGDSLTIQYNQTMQGADFENAVYVLTP